jgi:hypothetical protein
MRALLHTVTTDNGKEFAYHKKVSEELEVDCYFAKPYHSWERAGRPVPSQRKSERAGQAVFSERDELWPNHRAESERGSYNFKQKAQEEIWV